MCSLTHVDSTDIIVGYKGDGEMDAALLPIYPTMSSGTVLDLHLSPVSMTRYGYVELTNQAHPW